MIISGVLTISTGGPATSGTMYAARPGTGLIEAASDVGADGSYLLTGLEDAEYQVYGYAQVGGERWPTQMRHVVSSPSPGTAPTVTIDQGATVSIEEGASLQLTATATGDPTPIVAWSSSDDTVAAVGATGLVTGVAPGAATITASAANTEGSAVATTEATVTAIPVPPTTTWYTDFRDYAVGQRPMDLRRSRMVYGYDLLIAADAGVPSGKILKLVGTVAGSHANTFRGLGTEANTARQRESRVKLRAPTLPTVANNGAGGAILTSMIDAADWNSTDPDLAGTLPFYEIGMRLVGGGSGITSIIPWRYHPGVSGAGNFAAWGGVNAGAAGIAVAGEWMWLAIRADLDDKTAGPNGTIWFKAWRDGTAEPAWGLNAGGSGTWSSGPLDIGQDFTGKLGEPGIYTNDPAFGVEYGAWGYAINGGAAPSSGTAFAPAPLPAPLELVAAHGFPAIMDFSGYADGDAVTEFTREYQADDSVAYTFLARADADGVGGRVARLDNPNGADRRGFMYHAASGTALTTQEILVLMRLNQAVTTPPYHGGVGLRVEGAAGAGDSGIAVTLQYDLGRYRLMGHRFYGGAFGAGVFGADLPGLSPNNPQGAWMWVRARMEGPQLRAKAWPALESEPHDWPAGAVISDPSVATGGIGPYLYNNNVTIDYDVVAVKVA